MNVSAGQQAQAEERRWWILGVLAFSLLVIVLDTTIVNVALPSIVRELRASDSQLQWIVDAYSLSFAGLLLTMGSLGDKFGRRPALLLGYVVFGLGSTSAALVNGPTALIACRAFMGVGAALIMPATLSIITNIFPVNERPKAIGIWAATSGVGVALGPLVGGFLLSRFYWGSIFLVNLPVVAFGLLAGIALIPNSKDPGAPRLDPVGAGLSIVGLSTVLYAVIEAPTKGWTANTILAYFAIGAISLAAFFWWEHRSDHPMLDLSFFKNARFSAASGSITVIFFALSGSIFLLTQYLQFILGFSALQTGVRLLTFAIPLMVVSPLAPQLVNRIGTKACVAAGLVAMSAALLLLSGVDQTTAFADTAWRLTLMAIGMALVMSPATESVMGSVPLARSGVGSAVNDTTREVGGAVGVAVVGSVFSAVYNAKIADAFRGQPAAVVGAAKSSVGEALAVAARLPGAAGRTLSALAVHAFIEGLHSGLLLAGLTTLVGAVGAVIFLPARPHAADVERQAREFEAEWSTAGAPTPAGDRLAADRHASDERPTATARTTRRTHHKPWHAKL